MNSAATSDEKPPRIEYHVTIPLTVDAVDVEMRLRLTTGDIFVAVWQTGRYISIRAYFILLGNGIVVDYSEASGRNNNNMTRVRRLRQGQIDQYADQPQR